MRCPNCGTDNPSKAFYCRECSHELRFTPEQVAAAMADEIRKERVARMERQLRSLIALVIALLIIAYVLHNYAADLPRIHLSTFVELPPSRSLRTDYLLPKAPPIPIPEPGPVAPPVSVGSVEPDAKKLRAFYLSHPLHTVYLKGNRTVRGDVILKTRDTVHVRIKSGKVQSYKSEEIVKIEPPVK